MFDNIYFGSCYTCVEVGNIRYSINWFSNGRHVADGLSWFRDKENNIDAFSKAF